MKNHESEQTEHAGSVGRAGRTVLLPPYPVVLPPRVQQADEVLFQGLHFSRLDTLITVLWNEFADEVPAGRAREVALQLLPECGKVFSGYDLTDGFEFTPDFDRLCGELAGAISIWLEENGI